MFKSIFSWGNLILLFFAGEIFMQPIIMYQMLLRAVPVAIAGLTSRYIQVLLGQS